MSFRSLFPLQSHLIENGGIVPAWQVLFMSLYTTLGGASGQVIFGPSKIKPTRTSTLTLGDTKIGLKGFILNGLIGQSGVVIAQSLSQSGLSSDPFSAGISYPTGTLTKTLNLTVPTGWDALPAQQQGRVLAAAGAGESLTPRTSGQVVGEYTHLTTLAETPIHEHSVPERSNDPNLTAFKLENYGTYNLNGRFAESTPEPTSSPNYTQQNRNNTQESVFIQVIEKQG